MTKPPRGRRKSPLDHDPEALVWAFKKSGLTQKAFADAIGKSASMVSEMFKGTRNMTPATMQAAAVALNCPLTVLERKRHPGSKAA